ncbi:DNA recombination protein RmuC [Pseudohoeflea suaedae]|uniref:DNA recombination protein RmuC homolog n=1 Tax=Pseudohoeflea suaedae TaxID=877384 RepID=A0A4R5PNA6_9HYPH|nr:DNA recombination protein RmuC [Pseudohoeflea suaedae]TDH38081.1 DNA recombination protein RmuC [Pseudohoeflea suaedae]
MNEQAASPNSILFRVGEIPVTLTGLLVVALIVAAAISLVLLLLLSRASRQRAAAERAASERAQHAEDRLGDILKAQSEMQGRMGAMAEMFGTRQAEFNHAINQRIDGMTQRIGTTLSEQTKSTHENLARLQERLAVIDTAQNNIQTLARDVVGLQAILSNKQTRGAFGQSRMETIVKDGLPFGSYEFQRTLSNGTRPDCTITMPNGAPDLVIDAKFPLEAWNAMRETEPGDTASLAQATQRFRRDMEVHIRDISEKYLITGETQDTAFLFVPSESIFAEIHENFEGIVQRAHRARVVIVSPSLLMLSVQVVQALLKDARMREQAHLIQGEVLRLMEDLSRLDERVRKLQTHFGQAQRDIDQILTSTDKLTKRGSKIEMLEFEASPRAGASHRGESDGPEERSGKLRLRVVDED